MKNSTFLVIAALVIPCLGTIQKSHLLPRGMEHENTAIHMPPEINAHLRYEDLCREACEELRAAYSHYSFLTPLIIHRTISAVRGLQHISNSNQSEDIKKYITQNIDSLDGFLVMFFHTMKEIGHDAHLKITLRELEAKAFCHHHLQNFRICSANNFYCTAHKSARTNRLWHAIDTSVVSPLRNALSAIGLLSHKHKKTNSRKIIQTYLGDFRGMRYSLLSSTGSILEKIMEESSQ